MGRKITLKKMPKHGPKWKIKFILVQYKYTRGTGYARGGKFFGFKVSSGHLDLFIYFFKKLNFDLGCPIIKTAQIDYRDGGAHRGVGALEGGGNAIVGLAKDVVDAGRETEL